MIASHTCASASDDVVMFRNVHIGHMQYIVQSLHSKVRFGEMTLTADDAYKTFFIKAPRQIDRSAL